MIAENSTVLLFYIVRILVLLAGINSLGAYRYSVLVYLSLSYTPKT